LHENNLSEPIEAYLSVPYSFTEQQREEFLHAAEIAGLKIVKLIEEPLAILNSTWRLEQNGQYLLAGASLYELNYYYQIWILMYLVTLDFGSNFRASVVRVFEGQFDILAHVEDVAITETVEKALVEYVMEKLAKVVSRSNAFMKFG
jgi:molecular chaperone DnaK (HSP70)